VIYSCFERVYFNIFENEWLWHMIRVQQFLQIFRKQSWIRLTWWNEKPVFVLDFKVKRPVRWASKSDLSATKIITMISMILITLSGVT
jgi:hypothetical protein